MYRNEIENFKAKIRTGHYLVLIGSSSGGPINLKENLLAKGLQHKYKYVPFTEIKTFEWGREIFKRDPSGVLWHFCQLNHKAPNGEPSVGLKQYAQPKHLLGQLFEKIKKACS